MQKDDRRCEAAAAAAPNIEPSDAVRTFIWSSDDAKRVILGVIEPQAKTIALQNDEQSEVTLAIRGDRKRGWPVETTVTLQGPKQTWAIPLAAKNVERLTAIRIPAGPYRLTIAAERHRTERRTVDAKKAVALREVALKPLPSIFGRVVNMKDEPLGGAQIVRGDGKIATHTDEQGSFRAELAEPQPAEILVIHPGFGSRVVPLAETLDADNDLATIRLSAGVDLTLHLLRDGEHDAAVTKVRLLRRNETTYEHTEITVRDVKAGESDIAFVDLSEGTYYAVLEGKDPIERLTEEIVMGEHGEEVEIRVAPFTLDGRARIGDEPISGAIEIQDRLHTWRARLTIDEHGKFGGTMWERGKHTGFIKFAKGGTPVESPELEGDPALWEIVFKNRFIAGRVYDAETNRPLPGARMRLERATGDPKRHMRLYSQVSLEPDGRYSVVAMENGIYELQVTAPQRITEKTKIEIRDADESKTLDFPMTQGTPVTVDVAWPTGEPAAQAQVVEGIASDGYNPAALYATDGAGRLTVHLRPGENKTLYVLPKEGSIAVVRAMAQRDGELVRVIVPLPSASLRVVVLNREPNRNIAVMMRINGEMLPQSVAMRVPHDRLPAGSYELWALTLPGDFSTLIGVVPSHPPTRVGLTTGEQTVEVKAEPLRR